MGTGWDSVCRAAGWSRTGAKLLAAIAAGNTEGLMTAKIGSAVTAKVLQRLSGPTGVNANVAALTQPGHGSGSFDAVEVRAQNVAADIAERSTALKYPAANVYCEKIVNELKEKFRRFSGRVQMVIELRHSQDRLDGLQDRLELYADATMAWLHAGRGDWGDGVFYGGKYEVSFGPVKQGGRNFIQAAKVTFEIGVSKN
jgi:hypothetical protein